MFSTRLVLIGSPLPTTPASGGGGGGGSGFDGPKLPSFLVGKNQLHVKQRNNNKMRSSSKTAVASLDSNQLTPSDDKEERGNKYHFVVANAKFMLDEEEHFKEHLFERLRNYGERNKEQDFWLVIEPKFLEKFPEITRRLKRPAVALVSTNATWITFMKLRLDRVLSHSFEAESLEEALASNPAKLEFEKPEKWTAPYPKYEYGWWEPFLPAGLVQSKV